MKRGILLCLSIAILIISCKRHGESSKVNEGTITYQVIYQQTEAENPVISLMPKNIILRFKDQKTIMEINGWLNIFTASVINDYEKMQSINLIKILNNRYYYITPISKPLLAFDDLPNMKVMPTACKEEIAGYTCSSAMVSFSDTENIKPYKIFYTNKIGIDSPNRFTPFHNIDGVLMDFQIVFHKIPMHLKAIEVSSKKVDDWHYTIPADYKPIERDSLIAIIDSLL